MSKICTSIEQSQKLIELGIDINTADMCWQNNEFPIGFNDDEAVPAWSLTALLELIPSNVFLYSKLVKWDESYYIENREMLYDNPVDAVFEMVCWLKENNKI